MSSETAKTQFRRKTAISASQTRPFLGFPPDPASGSDRSRVTPGIVISELACSTAHQAVVIDDLLAGGATDWASSAPACAVRDARCPHPAGLPLHDAVRLRRGHRSPDHRFGPYAKSPKKTLAVDRAPDHLATRIVSLTVTERLLPQAADRRSGRAPSRHRS